MRIQHGSEYMEMNDKGEITRPEIGMNTPSGHWKVTGAVTRNNFGRVTRQYSLAEILADPNSIPWKFANGKQKTFVQDYDHGTHREWRSPGHCVFLSP